ncbi:MAG: polysaccharide deacetylase family protein [Pseudomonadota bacterium]
MKIFNCLKSNKINKGIILLYHSISDKKPDPQLLNVSRRNFEAHLMFLKNNLNPISLDDLVKSIEHGNVPDKSVAITFDDGYANNLYNGKVLLEKHNIPATVFIASNYIGSKKGTTSSRLQAILLEPKKLPGSLDFEVDGKKYFWNFENDQIDDTWNVTRPDFPSQRYECYFKLHYLLRSKDSFQREMILDSLAEKLNVKHENLEDYRFLNMHELIKLSASPLIDIGGHTNSHVVLASQSSDIQIKEINENKVWLEKRLNKKITNFAYPYGSANDVSKKTKKITRDVGYNAGLANVEGMVSKRSDLYWLPRYLIRNWDVDVFKNIVDKVFSEKR